jgi:hypothetical protein
VLHTALLAAEFEFGTRGRAKARGVQAVRAAVLPDLRAAAAIAYLALGQNGAGPKSWQRAAQYAETRLAARVGDWKAYSATDRRILLTAFIVRTAWTPAWAELGLKDPFSAPDELKADTFYRTYIQPALHDVRQKRFSRAHAAYLRFLTRRVSRS